MGKENVMEIRAIPFEQQGDRFWIGAMTASDLVKSTTIDHWSLSNREGYQRGESERRARSFATFLTRESLPHSGTAECTAPW